MAGKTLNLKRLPAREREIAELVLERGEASASEVLDLLESPLSNSAVRSMLRRLEEKGYLRHSVQGRKWIYSPSASLPSSREAVLRRIAADYFEGSISALSKCVAGMQRESVSHSVRRLPATLPEPVEFGRALAGPQSERCCPVGEPV